MKALIVYMSIHHGNTEKVARRMAKALGADLIRAGEIKDPSILGKYDLVGFGSGIYFGRLHRAIFDFVDRMPTSSGKKAFVFYTSGAGEGFYNRMYLPGFLKKLREKGYEAMGIFSCLGYDTYGLLKWVGGINKGKPDERDLQAAEDFAKSLAIKMK